MLTIDGAVAQPRTLTLAELQTQYTPYTVDTSYANDNRIATATYTGALLWDVLQAAGVNLNAEQPELMRVMARSVDGFRCIVKWHEFDPAADNNRILIGYQQDGQAIAGKHGPLRLVVPSDAQGLRYIGNLTTITVLNRRSGDE